MDDAGSLLRYLNDHLAGSDAALELLGRLEESAVTEATRREIETLHREIERDQQVLRVLIARIGAESAVKRALGWLAEKATRLKVGAISRDAGFALFESLEILALGIQGKASLWRALATLATQTPELGDLDLPDLLRRAEAQHARVERWRLALAPSALLSS